MVIHAWCCDFVKIVESFYLQVRNIFPHISLRDLPCHRTMKKYDNSRSMEVFQFRQRKFVIQTWLCNCPQYLCLFHIVVECSPSIHDQGKMLVLPNRLLCWVISTSDQCFVSFQPIFMSSTFTDKNNPFSRCTNKHSQLEAFSQPYFK